MTREPRCLSLRDAHGPEAGGKARGLAALMALGVRVPPGFVVIDATPESLPTDLAERYHELGGGKVAVRSSAVDEDTEDASFAGQHDTLLGIEGVDALENAVRACLASAASEHATAYRERRAGARPATMSVVVQRMVDARAAGVLFTVDPVSARRDRLVIDSVVGLGDRLVAGEITPDHFELDPRCAVVRRELTGSAPSIGDATLVALAREARDAEAMRGHPLDMEWAVDADGLVHWLQARPITELPGDVRELDTWPRHGHFYTKCNIGEMMPGAVTPLTWSLSGRGIDHGMQWMYTALGALDGVAREPRFVGMYFGHLFLDLTALCELGRFVAGSSAERTCVAICGRPVPELVVGGPATTVERARNGLRYARLLLSGRAHTRALANLVDSLVFPEGPTAAAVYAAIDRRVPDLLAAYAHHLVASAGAGTMAPVLLEIVAGGESPSERHHAEVASLLAFADDVESHDIAAGIDRIVGKLHAHPELAERFASLALEDAAIVLSSAEAGAARDEYLRYLQRHGHRTVREIEFRQKEWGADPMPVVEAVQRGLRARLSGASRPVVPRSGLPLRLRPLVALAHGGVRARERTKSLLVLATARFKAAYRILAAHLVVEGLLPDEDLVYFLTHEEVGRLVSTGDTSLAPRAAARRRALPLQQGLVFDEVFLEAPEPLEPPPPTGERVLLGKPVSRGVARGRARVARTLEEARAVEPGEILIAPITDVGWTPCFGVIAGLATDIGSAVSHGAVVAREYGLPAIVNLRTATLVFRTGDRVVLDADAGVLRLDD